MRLPHRRGYKDAGEAMRSTAFMANPGATVVTDCPCGQIHVDLPSARPVQLRGPRRDTGFPAAAADPRGVTAA
jgi:hypothetical protein